MIRDTVSAAAAVLALIWFASRFAPSGILDLVKPVFFSLRAGQNMIIYSMVFPRNGGAGRIKLRGAEALKGDILLSFIATDFFPGVPGIPREDPSSKETSMNIYVGNLSFTVTEQDLRAAFEVYGTVEKAAIITDKMTGQPRGFGFVEMPNKDEAVKAISGLNGKDLKGRNLKVNEAQPRPAGGGGGRGGFGGGRGRY
jgi:cold-inducible RNA-binding protein